MPSKHVREIALKQVVILDNNPLENFGKTCATISIAGDHRNLHGILVPTYMYIHLYTIYVATCTV